MAGTPGYRVSLKASGTPTASTGNTFTYVSGTTADTYQISSTARRVFDRTVAPSAFQTSTGGAISSTDILSVDYLFGKVTFKTTSHTTSITGDVTYLPLSAVAGANTFSLNMARDLLDDTDFSSTGFRSREPALMDVQLTMSRWDTLDTEWAHRLLSTSVNSSAASTGSNQVVVEIRPDSTGKYAVGFFRIETESLSGDVSALEQSDISLQLDSDKGSNAGDKMDFGWSDQ